MLGSGFPSGVEVELLNQFECVDAVHVEITAHVRQMSVGPDPAWLGPLGGYNTPLLYIGESIGDEKRVASNLLDLYISQVTGVPLLGNAGDQFHDQRFIKH